MLRYRNRDLIEPFGIDELITAAHGQALLPWPNRITAGRYSFAGVDHQLALTQPNEGCAIHGLTRWMPWTLDVDDGQRSCWSLRLHPQPGYPHSLDVSLEYHLGRDGLTVTVTTVNVGPDPAPFGAGFHPYLVAPGGTVDGSRLTLPARRYRGGNPAASHPVAGTAWDFRDGVTLQGVTLDHGFTDLDSVDGRWVARLAGSGVATELWGDEAFKWIQVFTADAFGRHAVALEPMTCPADAFNSGLDLIVVQPGQTWSAQWGIRSVA